MAGDCRHRGEVDRAVHDGTDTGEGPRSGVECGAFDASASGGLEGGFDKPQLVWGEDLDVNGTVRCWLRVRHSVSVPDLFDSARRTTKGKKL
jgi:hypothetical protein